MSSFHRANFVRNIFRFANTYARHLRRRTPKSSTFPYLPKISYPITPTTKIYWTQNASSFHPANLVRNIFRFENTCARHLRRSAPKSSTFPCLPKISYPVTPTTKIHWTQSASSFHPANLYETSSGLRTLAPDTCAGVHLSPLHFPTCRRLATL